MSHPIPPPPEEAPRPLPDLRTAQLDDEGVDDLLRDIEQCSELLEIVPKETVQDLIAEPAQRLTFADARALVRERRVRGLQIRYRHEGAEWWDTLMNRGAGWRLVRIRHEWGA